MRYKIMMTLNDPLKQFSAWSGASAFRLLCRRIRNIKQ